MIFYFEYTFPYFIVTCLFRNPTPSGEPFQWKPAAKDTKDCLMISDELEMKTNLHEDRIKFWDDFIEKYRQIAVDGVVKGTKDEL